MGAVGSLVIGSVAAYHTYTRREAAGRPLPHTKLVRPTAYAITSASLGSLVRGRWVGPERMKRDKL
jgi:hypothetical protein